MKKISILVTTLFVLLACAQNGAPNTAQNTAPNTAQNTIQDNGWTQEFSNSLGQKYTGNVELKGWLTNKSRYGDETPEPHFHISNESMKNLPENINNADFRLTTAKDGKNTAVSQEIISDLSSFSEQNPATILVDELIFYSEGTPTLNFRELNQK